MLDRPEEEIDLAEAALLIAKNAYRDLDVPGYLARIGELAGKLSAQLPEDGTESSRIVALNRFLFEDQGFAPSVEITMTRATASSMRSWNGAWAFR